MFTGVLRLKPVPDLRRRNVSLGSGHPILERNFENEFDLFEVNVISFKSGFGLGHRLETGMECQHSQRHAKD